MRIQIDSEAAGEPQQAAPGAGGGGGGVSTSYRARRSARRAQASDGSTHAHENGAQASEGGALGSQGGAQTDISPNGGPRMSASPVRAGVRLDPIPVSSLPDEPEPVVVGPGTARSTKTNKTSKTARQHRGKSKSHRGAESVSSMGMGDEVIAPPQPSGTLRVLRAAMGMLEPTLASTVPSARQGLTAPGRTTRRAEDDGLATLDAPQIAAQAAAADGALPDRSGGAGAEGGEELQRRRWPVKRKRLPNTVPKQVLEAVGRANPLLVAPVMRLGRIASDQRWIRLALLLLELAAVLAALLAERWAELPPYPPEAPGIRAGLMAVWAGTPEVRYEPDGLCALLGTSRARKLRAAAAGACGGSLPGIGRLAFGLTAAGGGLGALLLLVDVGHLVALWNARRPLQPSPIHLVALTLRSLATACLIGGIAAWGAWFSLLGSGGVPVNAVPGPSPLVLIGACLLSAVGVFALGHALRQRLYHDVRGLHGSLFAVERLCLDRLGNVPEMLPFFGGGGASGPLAARGLEAAQGWPVTHRTARSRSSHHTDLSDNPDLLAGLAAGPRPQHAPPPGLGEGAPAGPGEGVPGGPGEVPVRQTPPVPPIRPPAGPPPDDSDSDRAAPVPQPVVHPPPPEPDGPLDDAEAPAARAELALQLPDALRAGRLSAGPSPAASPAPSPTRIVAGGRTARDAPRSAPTLAADAHDASAPLQQQPPSSFVRPRSGSTLTQGPGEEKGRGRKDEGREAPQAAPAPAPAPAAPAPEPAPAQAAPTPARKAAPAPAPRAAPSSSPGLGAPSPGLAPPSPGARGSPSPLGAPPSPIGPPSPFGEGRAGRPKLAMDDAAAAGRRKQLPPLTGGAGGLQAKGSVLASVKALLGDEDAPAAAGPGPRPGPANGGALRRYLEDTLDSPRSAAPDARD